MKEIYLEIVEQSKIKLINKVKKSKIFYLNLGWTTILFAVVIFLACYLNIKYNTQFYNSVTENNGGYNGSVVYYLWIVMESFWMLAYTVILVISLFTVEYEMTHWKEKVIYSILTVNIIRLIFVLIVAYKTNNLEFRFRKWISFDYLLISMGICMYMLLTFVCKQLIPTIPVLFISLSLEYIALFFVAYITSSFLKTLLTTFICGMLLLVFPNIYFINFGQFFFDYLLPTMSVSLAAFVKIDKKDTKKFSKWFTFITLPYLVIYISRIMAGVIFYGTWAYPGFPILLYSVIINGLNTMVDYLTLMIIGPLILGRIWVLRNKYLIKFNKK